VFAPEDTACGYTSGLKLIQIDGLSIIKGIIRQRNVKPVGPGKGVRRAIWGNKDGGVMKTRLDSCLGMNRPAARRQEMSSDETHLPGARCTIANNIIFSQEKKTKKNQQLPNELNDA
jgi:hypothetical protein